MRTVDQLMRLHQQQTGYTLLEVMLAIVVIATITVFSMSLFQQQTFNSQIDRVALQVQQWLEAAKAYYVDHNQWPDGYNKLNADCLNADKDPTANLLEGNCGPMPRKQYIQSGTVIENNAWGQAFKLLPPSQQSNQNSVMFQVESIVPARLKNPLQLAQRVASRLPNAVTSANDDGISVIAAITIPGTSSIVQNQVIIKSIQDITCGQNGDNCSPLPLKPNDCPANTQPFMSVALQQFQPQAGGAPTTLAKVEVGPINYNANQPWPKPKLVTTNPAGKNSIGTLLVITGCKPINPTAVNNSINNFFKY